MSNIIKFPEKKDTDSFEYFKANNSLGVQSKIGVFRVTKWRLGDNQFHIGMANDVYEREVLAEILWAAAYYLDSEQRYMPEGDLIGINYED